MATQISSSNSSTDNRLKLVSFNMRGFNQGYSAIEELIVDYEPDIFLLQEHWLTPANLNAFDKKFANYFTFGCSAMLHSVSSGFARLVALFL